MTVSQLLAILCIAFLLGMIVHKAYADISALARQHSGEAFRLACNQCNVLPDTQRYTAAEWPRVVARMRENMEWMNRVVGSKPVPGEPQLAVEEIKAFLARHARKPGG